MASIEILHRQVAIAVQEGDLLTVGREAWRASPHLGPGKAFHLGGQAAVETRFTRFAAADGVEVLGATSTAHEQQFFTAGQPDRVVISGGVGIDAIGGKSLLGSSHQQIALAAEGDLFAVGREGRGGGAGKVQILDSGVGQVLGSEEFERHDLATRSIQFPAMKSLLEDHDVAIITDTGKSHRIVLEGGPDPSISMVDVTFDQLPTAIDILDHQEPLLVDPYRRGMGDSSRGEWTPVTTLEVVQPDLPRLRSAIALASPIGPLTLRQQLLTIGRVAGAG